MEPRARRHQIRHHLNNARAELDVGDRTAALREVHAALSLDPEYLAAQALRERIEQLPPAGRSFDLPAEPAPPPEPSQRYEAPPRHIPLTAISAAGWARFEHRARVRRIEKRAAAARAAISRGRFGEARAALDDIREMDEAHPDLISLGIELDAAEHLAEEPTFRWGAVFAAVVVFGALVLGSRYLGRPSAVSPASRTVSQTAVVDEQSRQAPADLPRYPAASPGSAAEPPRSGENARAIVAAAGDDVPAPADVTGQLPAAPVSPVPQPPSEPRSGALPTERSAAPPSGSAEQTSAKLPQPATPREAMRPGERAPAERTAADRQAADRPESDRPAADRRAADRQGSETPPDPSATGLASRTDRPRPIVWPPVTRATAASPPAPVAATTGSLAAKEPVVTAPAPDTAIAAPASPAVLQAVSPAALPGELSADTNPARPTRPTAREPETSISRTANASAAVITPRDEDMVRETLQRYRTAYESLDAESAQAVWPRVDGAALQRAFDGLQSQQLTFDACQVQVRGGTGSAVCRGSARYVPKVGSREPRVEPRVWTFALHKSGDDWQIDTARAER